MWDTKQTTRVFNTHTVSIIEEIIVDQNGDEQTIHSIAPGNGAVMVVPMKIVNDQVKYIMVEQYRHCTGLMQLEFPGGSRDKAEASKDAALRELKEETGYSVKWIKFIYSFFPEVARSAGQMSVFLAQVEDEPSKVELDKWESISGLKVVELTADELHRKVLDNEIVAGTTLSALGVAMLQSKEATKYLLPSDDDGLELK